MMQIRQSQHLVERRARRWYTHIPRSRNIVPFSSTNSITGNDNENPQRFVPYNRHYHSDSLSATRRKPPQEQRGRTMSSSSVPFYGGARPKNTSGVMLSPLSLLQRITVATHSAITAWSDPTRADAVAALGEITGRVALRRMYDRMMSHPVGQRVLRDRPLVNGRTIDLNQLAMGSDSPVVNDVDDGSGKLNDSRNIDDTTTFGQAYAAFMKGHDFDPDERSQVRFIEDPDLAYVMLRYRQCHDFWHVLTGLPPTVVGELGLKWLELIQTGLPVAALSATVGSLRLNSKDGELLNAHYLPWAVRVGTNATYLMNVYYEEEFDMNLKELRERLGVEPAPRLEE